MLYNKPSGRPCVLLFFLFMILLKTEKLLAVHGFMGSRTAVKDRRVIKSQGYPDSYPRFMKDEWSIRPGKGGNVWITVIDHDLKIGTNCTADYLAFYDGIPASWNHLRTVCANSPQYLFFLNNFPHLYVEFRTGLEFSNNRGFILDYRLESGDCPESAQAFTADDKGVEITSPRYPRFYRHTGLYYCSWLITSTREFVRIQIKFLDLDGRYYDIGDCSTDYLTLYNGNSSLDPLLGSFCPTSPSSNPFKSSSKIVYLEVAHMGGTSRQFGFQVLFQATDTSYAECPSELVNIVADDKESEITSPTYPNIYGVPNNNGDSCRWLVSSTRAYINIKLKAFDLDGEVNPRSCDLNFLNISNGDSSTDQIVRSFCEKSSSAVTFTSGSSKVLITFNHEWTPFGNGGFKLLVQATDEYPECPSELVSIVADDDGSEITSPGYPNIYTIPNNNGDPCLWVVTSTRAYIKITLEAFDLDGEFNSMSCDLNFLNISNGESSTDPILRSFCEKSSSVVTFTSGASKVRITFNHEWTSFTNGGFKLFVQATDEYPECPSEIVNIVADDEGSEITSPGYPNIYSVPNNNGDPCRWLVTSTRYHIKITLEAFDVDGEINPRSCDLNFLNISNGDSSKDPILRSFCERSSTAVTFTAPSREVFMTFNHEWTPFRNGGFKLIVQATNEYPECSSEIVDIVANDEGSEITSPGYPNIYGFPNHYGKPCCWLVASTRASIEVTVEEFNLHLEYRRECDSNFLIIYNGASSMDPILRSFCVGYASGVTFTSRSSMILITFEHDWYVFTNGGFKLVVRATDEYPGCRTGYELFELHDDREIDMISPGFPRGYPTNMDCRWHVRTDDWALISIEFIILDMPSDANCANHKLDIYDGDPSYPSLLASFNCENSAKPESPLYSSSSTVFVQFKSGQELTRNSGFKIALKRVTSRPEDEPSDDAATTDSDNTKIIIIVVVVVVVVTCNVLVAICIFVRRYRKKRALQSRVHTQPTMPRPVITPGNVIHTDSLQAGTYHPDVPISSLPESERNRPADVHADLPPSYHEGTSNSANGEHLIDPPPYIPTSPGDAFGNTAYVHTEGADHHTPEVQRL